MTDKHTPLRDHLARSLEAAIANLGYPVGMGVAPNSLTMDKAADNIMKLIADSIGISTQAIEAGAVAGLVSAAELMQRLVDEALPQFNWGQSALDANSYQLLNEAPLALRTALANMGVKP